MLRNYKIGFIGAGNMTEAIVRGITTKTNPALIAVSDINEARLDMFKTQYKVGQANIDNKRTVDFCDILFIATKPQIIPDVLDELKDDIGDRLVVSIAAGVQCPTIESHLPEGTRVVRVMANTPALVMTGATAVCAGSHATDDDVDLIKSIFELVGVCVVVKEDRMDAITGLSGSGPAFVYMFIDALSDGGVNMGLTRANATLLAAQTVMGAAKMVLETGVHPCQLKDNVTTPAGTTIKALHAMDKAGFRPAVIDAVEAATLKSRELGKTKKDD
ncbi:pyrroline-5-carboxylate reductase [Limisalsivibrio acetivorans]|uniref:pyrroline-5-carboxylate reductase n=1 Tax=Limisalsivibrio acetivorans TaxID=1304888 RepID=UPI0003B362A7|nr:pyrroline-5-carboxylate reductase [Limisalsivibrio acetivorans]